MATMAFVMLLLVLVVMMMAYHCKGHCKVWYGPEQCNGMVLYHGMGGAFGQDMRTLV